MADPVMAVVIGVVTGIVFGLNGYFTKRDPDEAFAPRKVARTVVIFGAAGALVGYAGDPLTQANVVAMTGTTAVLGKLVDEWWSWMRRNTGG